MKGGCFSTDATFSPWWWEALDPEPAAGPGPLPGSVDVAVVGSGYTGLSAALTLARAGRSVVVLEAGRAGYGASTRNGGQVGSGNQKFTVQKLIALYGRDKALALIHEGTAMLAFIADLIETEGIDCHFRRAGRFRGAVRPAHYEAMARDMEDLKRFAGVEFFMVPRAEQHREVGSDFYFGGGVLPNDAALHPGLYHQGLLRLAEAAGAQVYDHTPVTGLAPRGREIGVQTSRGVISARNVVVATNGYTGAGLEPFRTRVVPIGTSTVATEPLPEATLARIMPTGRVYGNTARVFHYFRAASDQPRLLFGGRVGRLVSQDSPRAYTHLYRDMLRVFPDLAGVRLTHGWSGYIAYTADTLPHIGVHNGIHYAMGYCGTGVSRSTYFGHKLALKILGKPEGRTAFDDLPFSSFRFHFASPLGVAAVESWYRIRDALES